MRGERKEIAEIEGEEIEERRREAKKIITFQKNRPTKKE
jgi:hypothetical protein